MDTPQEVRVDADRLSETALELEVDLLCKVIGQDRAVHQFVKAFETAQAGLCEPGRPIANLLFLGPSGVGKTRIVEAAAESLLGDRRAVIKVDCGEFQHSHEIAKLIGSPPGYLGHRETHPIITQETLAAYHTDKRKLSFLLFDEIEKASDSVQRLLLGMMDKATLTLGDNRKVDLSKTIIVLTSNLGAHDISTIMAGNQFGFHPEGMSHAAQDKDIYESSMFAVRKHFTPEFIGRLDRTVVFRPLSQESLRLILKLELQHVQDMLLASGKIVYIDFTEAAKEFLLAESDDAREGARQIKKSLKRFVTSKLASLVATSQIQTGDGLRVDKISTENSLAFFVKSKMLEIPPSRIQ
jgi:ATP-dependent Clp protease ATP-binding subunit ClpB